MRVKCPTPSGAKPNCLPPARKETKDLDAFKEGYSKGIRKSNRELELEKENAALREEVEILKKAAAFLANVKRD